MTSSIPLIRQYQGQIVLDTPLFIGAGNPKGLSGTNQVQLDGRDKPGIPGTALAGVYFDDLEWVQSSRNWRQPEKQWLGLSGKLTRQKDIDIGRSALMFSSAVIAKKLDSSCCINIRDRICLNQETRTVNERNKFAQQQVIGGSRFDFELEIETSFMAPGLSNNPGHDERDRILEQLLEQIETVLAKWVREGLLIGNSSAAGNGWARLDGLKKWDVTKENYNLYLDANDAKTHDLFGNVSLPSDVGFRNKPIPFSIVLDSMENEDSWGIDFIEIHQGDHSTFTSDMDAPFYAENRYIGGGQIKTFYIIPGSSLRGAMRAYLSGFYKEKWIGLWFGWPASEEQGLRGLIRVRDAIGAEVTPENQWSIPAHAEDELTASTYEDSLFDRCPLVQGEFESVICYPNIYPDDEKEMDKKEWFERAFDLLHLREGGYKKTDSWVEDALKELPNAVAFFFRQAEKNRVNLGHAGGRPKWVPAA